MIFVSNTFLLHVQSIQNAQYITSVLPVSSNGYLCLLEVLQASIPTS